MNILRYSNIIVPIIILFWYIYCNQNELCVVKDCDSNTYLKKWLELNRDNIYTNIENNNNNNNNNNNKNNNNNDLVSSTKIKDLEFN